LMVISLGIDDDDKQKEKNIAEEAKKVQSLVGMPFQQVEIRRQFSF